MSERVSGGASPVGFARGAYSSPRYRFRPVVNGRDEDDGCGGIRIAPAPSTSIHFPQDSLAHTKPFLLQPSVVLISHKSLPSMNRPCDPIRVKIFHGEISELSSTVQSDAVICCCSTGDISHPSGSSFGDMCSASRIDPEELSHSPGGIIRSSRCEDVLYIPQAFPAQPFKKLWVVNALHRVPEGALTAADLINMWTSLKLASSEILTDGVCTITIAMLGIECATANVNVHDGIQEMLSWLQYVAHFTSSTSDLSEIRIVTNSVPTASALSAAYDTLIAFNHEEMSSQIKHRAHLFERIFTSPNPSLSTHPPIMRCLHLAQKALHALVHSFKVFPEMRDDDTSLFAVVVGMNCRVVVECLTKMLLLLEGDEEAANASISHRMQAMRSAGLIDVDLYQEYRTIMFTARKCAHSTLHCVTLVDVGASLGAVCAILSNVGTQFGD